jgi:PAS domain S-box-containing protein
MKLMDQSPGVAASSTLPTALLSVFDAGRDSIESVQARARSAFPAAKFIVWEGDPATFAFSYVGADAESLLGYPAADWIDSPGFWVDHVVHPDDRREALACCALATGRGRDQLFEYRALRNDGSIVWMLDYVNVVRGGRGVPSRLRGIMFDITAAKQRAGLPQALPGLREPSQDQLEQVIE